MASTWAVDSAPARSAASVEGRDAKREEVSSVVRAAPTEAPVAAANQSAASRCAPPCFQAPVATTWRAASDLPAALRRSSSPNASTSERAPVPSNRSGSNSASSRRTLPDRIVEDFEHRTSRSRGAIEPGKLSPTLYEHMFECKGQSGSHGLSAAARAGRILVALRAEHILRRSSRAAGPAPPAASRSPYAIEIRRRSRPERWTNGIEAVRLRHRRRWIGGSGAGARLSEEATCSVLVLEAGPTGPLDSDADLLSNVSFALTGHDWGVRARVTGERELDYPQGKFLGGGSSVNGALAFRGSPADYDGWAAQHNPRWSWDHMLPCFRRLEHDLDFGADHAVHGEDGPVPIVRWGDDELLPVQRAFADACVSMGLPWVPDHNHPAATGIGPLPMNRAEGRRMSTALAYLAPALARPNLTIRGGAQVDRVRIEHGRATGVVVVHEGDVDLVEAGEVIVSAGAIHSPAILWRSGIGPAGDLQQLGIACLVDNAAVGANLMDHPGLFHFLHPGHRTPDLACATVPTRAGVVPPTPRAWRTTCSSA